MLSSKNVFWEAFLLALLIFFLGILFGFFIENARTEKISELYEESEINLKDLEVMVYSLDSLDCSIAIESLKVFADNVFWESQKLEQFDNANEITSNIKLEHKKYDILRAALWSGAVKTKKRCGKFDTIVYIYDYDTENLGIKSLQLAFSRILMDLKDKKGESLILIPFAGNVKSNSIEMLKKQYNITELPTIIINEKVKITNIEKAGEIEKYLK